MIPEFAALEPLAGKLANRARAAGVGWIWRAQVRSAKSVVVKNGRAESTSSGTASGHGTQVFRPDGRSVLGSRDDFRERPALDLLDGLIDLSRGADALGIEPAAAARMEPARACEFPVAPQSFERVELPAVTERLLALEREILARVPGVRLSVSYQAVLDAWRIFREDGTDVAFGIPRCALSARATSAADGARHGVGASLFDERPEVPWDSAAVARFLERAERAARLALLLPGAPPHPPGSFPLVIDYALAKGLAHEAFGHASEADGFRSSVLAEGGRFRVGQPVGAPHVSIVDEPLRGDHAWQPFSANGVPRRRVAIVERGRLREALTDPWSARSAGVPLSGAERCQSYRHAPQPRMTNIRIEVDAPLPAPGPFERYGAEEVRELLREHGVFRRHERVAFLSGYSGGQVNTATGDFVFHCKAIYDLSPAGIALHKPAIFSGSMFGALESVREAFGPLLLDAIGTCGKWGQSVPSSGGSHYFLVLDPHPSVRLGGR